MNETIKKLLLMSGGKMKYGTAGTTTQTPLASSGGLLINIDSATGDIAQTASGWIENERFGFYHSEFATSTSAEYDTAVIRTGGKSLKLSTLDATGRARALLIPAGNYSTATTNITNSAKLIPVKVSTKYRLSCWIKTNNVASNSAFVEFVPIQSTGALASGGNTTNKLSGTTDWTRCTVEFTTDSNAVFLGLICKNDVAGNTGDAWFDINSMTLEEVVEPVANSLTSSSPSLVSFTAVGSTDNIDQSQTASTGDWAMTTAAPVIAQQFLPTKSKFTGVIIRKQATTGAWIGTATISIVNDSADSPSTTTYATTTLTAATWNAIANDTDYTINLPCNLTAGTKYWIKFVYTSVTATEIPVVRVSTPATVYSNGLFKYGDGTTWTVFGVDLYFKTLYYKPTTNFKASQNNQSVSISADEDGMLEGQVINLTTGRYSWDMNIGTRLQNVVNDFFSYTAATPYDATFSPANLYTSSSIRLYGATTSAQYILKVSPGLPINTVTVTPTLSTVATSSTLTIAISTDNISYTPIGTLLDDNLTTTFTTSLVDGATEFYLKFYVASGSTDVRITGLTIGGNITTSSLSTLRNYPTNKDIIKQYSTTLGSPTTSATYRATKWGFPAIEYSIFDSISPPVAKYDFEGNANDTSGNGYNATVNGATLTTGVTGDANSAYSFDGNDLITATNAMTLVGQDVSMSAWIYPTTLGATSHSRIFISQNDRYGIDISASGGGTIIAQVWDGGYKTAIATLAACGITVNKWSHVAMSHTGGTLKLYVDGIERASTSGIGTLLTSTTMYIGNWSSLTQGFIGKIDRVRIANTALTPTAIQQYIDVDTTATGSTVAFSETGASYTTVADGASLTITSTSTPNIFVKANITANRLYLSSNDYNASSDKDGSMKQSCTYQVIQ